MTPKSVTVVVTQEVVDAIRASTDGRNDVVQNWIAGAQIELNKVKLSDMFVDKKVNYEPDGDVLWA
jgi:hypothetical protein